MHALLQPAPGPAVPLIVVAAGATTVYVVGVLAYVVAQLRPILTTIEGVAHGLARQGIGIRGAGAPVSVVDGRAPAIAPPPGLVSHSALVPPWSQLLDLTVSTTPPATRWTDCGPESVAICIEACVGVETIAELLRLRQFGVIDTRLTAAADLAGMLERNHIHGQVVEVDSGGWQARIIYQRQRGLPAIVLKQFGLQQPISHWVVSEGATDRFYYEDPWSGTHQSLDWPTATSLFLGWLVAIDSPIRYSR